MTAEKTLKKILIVEDEKPMARALELKLKHSGFDAQIANDGQMALDLMKSSKFDLILLDHDLGEEDDPYIGNGYQFAKYLSNKGIVAEIVIHSLNLDGAKRMNDILPEAKRIPIINWRKK